MRPQTKLMQVSWTVKPLIWFRITRPPAAKGHFKELAEQGMVTLLETWLGTDALPPLWQSQRSCKFAVGSSWKLHQTAGVLNKEQVRAVRSVWSRNLWLERPNGIWASRAYEHNPMQGATSAQPRQERPDGTLSDIAKELDKQLGWATCQVPQSLKVWCTGLGGSDPPADDYDCTLACLGNTPTYGATMAGLTTLKASNPLLPRHMELCSGAKSQD